MKISIRSLGGKFLHEYRDALISKGIDYDKHVNIPFPDRSPEFQELKDVEINSIEELFEIFKDFEGFSYPDCQIAIDVKNKIVNIFDTWVE